MGETGKDRGAAKDQAVEATASPAKDDGPPQVTRREVAAALLGAIGGASIIGCLGEDGTFPADDEQIGRLREAVTGSGCYWCQTIGTPSSPGELRTTVTVPVPTYPGYVCIAEGFWQPGDGGGGIFWWLPGPTEGDDWGTAVASQVPGMVGHWKRIYSGPLSVKWFGTGKPVSPPDPPEDDQPAIQKAIDAVAVAGGTVHLPPGEYWIDRPLQFPWYNHTVSMRGAGTSATFIMTRLNTATAAIQCIGSHGSRAYVNLSDFMLDGRGEPNSKIGIYLEYSGPGSTLKRLYVKSFKDGIRVGTDLNLTISDCQCSYNSQWGLRAGITMADVSAAFTNNLRILGGQFTVNGSSTESQSGNMYLTGHNHVIDGTDLEAGRYYGLYAMMCSGLTINSCYLETSLESGSAVVGLYFHGCYGAVANGINVSNWRNDDLTVLFKAFNCHGLTMNCPSCAHVVEGVGVRIAGTAVHLESCMGVVINGPRFADIAKGIHAEIVWGAIAGPKFVNVGVPLETEDHEWVALSISAIEAAALRDSILGPSNRNVIVGQVRDGADTVGPCAQISSGVEHPEGLIAGSVGSIYLRVNGGVGNSLFVKEGGGVGKTGWVAK